MVCIIEVIYIYCAEKAGGEKSKNKVAKAHTKPEERKASAEAKRGTKLTRVLEIANLMRAIRLFICDWLVLDYGEYLYEDRISALPDIVIDHILYFCSNYKILVSPQIDEVTIGRNSPR
jgi:hypothetical protein